MKITFWKVIFYANLLILLLTTGLSVAVWFIMPDADVSITLSSKIWIMFVFGGLNRSVMQGFFLYYSYVRIQEEKKNVS